MKMQSRFLLIMLIILFYNFYSCNKIKYYPDTAYREVKTRILAHRAGPGGDSAYNAYSPEAARHALNIVNGIEVDLQLSKDHTIWLCHDAELLDCGGKSYNCFPESTDAQIVELDSCNGTSLNFYKLEDIFALLASIYPDKYISLDVKAWTPCGLGSDNVLGDMKLIGKELIRLTYKYNLQNHVLVESQTASFLDYVKKNSSGIECYLTSFGDFERAMQLTLESGYAGISFEYKFKEQIDSNHIQLIRRKGLKIQLWTVDSENDIREALSINPDYIQTDNLEYFKNLK